MSRFSAAFVPRSVPFLRRSPSLLSLSPHLHTHVVVANLGRGPEGRWSALDGRGLYAHASATDALYHAHLRYEL
ncbi:MAG TPA: relaxase domain-containing protein, partial [Acidimicrobiales bacterium]|nr:relaxase domain-containing protein [Acidimicrobiales bacterium]